MQQFHAHGVELDRCLKCGGVWFDGGELEDVLRRKLKVRPLGQAERKCVACRATMDLVELHDGVEVERCRTCHGVFLDAGELEALAAAAPHVAAQRKFLFFYCVDCGSRRDYEDGRPASRGRVCSECFEATQDAAAAEAQAQRDAGFFGALRRLFG